MENWDPSIDPTFRQGQCAFFTWQWTAPAAFEEDTLRLQDPEAKTHLFNKYLPQHRAQVEHGEQVLARLKKIDPAAAELFQVKPYLIDSMTLRLVNGDPTAAPKSYTALSYCWPEKPIESDAALGPGVRRVPIAPLLYQHSILQRETADEGVWCDQLCIDQSNAAEKDATIAAMDAIYACARMVVIVIEDVEVTEEEQQFLRAFIADYEDKEKHPKYPPPYVNEVPPFMQRNPILHSFYTRLFKARWFRRAWCSHEMRMGRRHRFLLRCAGFANQNTLLSFSDFFLSYLTLLAASVPMEDDVRLTVNSVHRVFNMNRYMHELKCALGIEAEARDKTDMSVVLPFTTQIAEVFSLGAGGNPAAADRERDANLDRIIIVLNSVGSGLSLRREVAAQSPLTSSTGQCQRLLLAVSLAAGDPTSLCTNGKPFQLLSPPAGTDDSPQGGPCSWLRKPHHTDIGSGSERQNVLPRMLDDDLRGLWLDTDAAFPSIVVGLYYPAPLEKPSEDLLKVASCMVSDARAAGLGGGFMGQMGQGPRYLGWRMEADFELTKAHFCGIVAIILQFGPEWLLGMTAKCGFSGGVILNELAQDVRAHFPIDRPFDTRYLYSGTWMDTPEGVRGVNAILRVAYWIRGWSLSIAPLADSLRWEWEPWICCFDEGRIQGLVIGPKGVAAAVPAGLMRYEYGRLPRVWLLGPTKEEDEFELKAKSVLFANLSEDDICPHPVDVRKAVPQVRDWSIRDPGLSDLGFDQCKELRAKLENTLPGWLDVETVFVSPMRRTLQTATESLDWLAAKGVLMYAHAGWQETTDHPCDVGVSVSEISPDFPGVDFSQVDPVFPDKTSEKGQVYAYNRRALVTRAQTVLAELYARPEKVVLVVSHSAFLSKAVSGAMFGNADYRIFSFADEGEELPEYDGHGDEKEVYPDLPPLKYRLKEWDETKSEGGMGWSYLERRQVGEGLPA